MGRALRVASLSAFLFVAALVYALAGQNITVNNAGDAAANDGVCTLREAITAANTNTPSGAAAGECAGGLPAPSLDVIGFDIAGGCSAPCTITPGTSLPAVTELVIIDGYLQVGAILNSLAVGNDAVLKIQINGATAGGTGLQLAAGSGGSTIRGLVINRFGDEILIQSSGNFVTGNFIGVDPAGTTDLSGAGSGILITSSGNTIGGTIPAARNVISGHNTGGVAAVFLNGAPATGNTIQGNYIGTNAAGTATIANFYGILAESAGGNTIGGTTAGARNVIAGGNIGVRLQSSNNTVQGNYIGLNAAGIGALGIGQGLRADNSNGNVFGGAAPGAGNVIAAAVDVGIRVTSSSNTTVRGNIIGMNALLTAVLGNGDGGVHVYGATGTLIRENVIFGNDATKPPNLGIDLDVDSVAPDDGVTPNDDGDSDTGSNNLQNFPFLTSASFSGGNTTISGTLNSTPNTSFTLEFFVNSACDPSGYGEGQRPIGTAPVMTDGSGNVSFGPLLFATADPLPFATATATNPANSTSEFSACISVDGAISGLSLHTLAPCRLADTRDPAGPSGGPALVAGASRSFPVAGLCNVPPGAKAVAVNVTVVDPTTGGHLTLHPAGGALPLASTINFRAGQVRANNAVLLVGSGGQVAVFAGIPSGTTHFVLDVNGYFE